MTAFLFDDDRFQPGTEVINLLTGMKGEVVSTRAVEGMFDWVNICSVKWEDGSTIDAYEDDLMSI